MAHHGKKDEMSQGEFHPKYHKIKVFCDEMRAMVEGEDAVKDTAEKMLPRPIGFTDDEYDLYRTRAIFPPALENTLSIMVARAFNNDPEVAQTSIDVDDLGKSGQSFDDILRWVVSEVATVAACGLLARTVNKDPADTRESPEQKPAIRMYRREDILDWHFDGGRLTYIRFDESGMELDPETLRRREVTKHVIYRIDAEGYAVAYEERKGNIDGEDFHTVDDPFELKIQGQRLTYIPFQFVGDPEATRSLMRPIGSLSKRYYEITAQFHWLLGKVSAPQFVIEWDKETNFETAMQFLTMATHSADAGGGGYVEGERHPHETRRQVASSASRNGSADPKIGAQSIMNLFGASAEYVEITGAGIQYIVNARDEVRDQLVFAGARAMADKTRSNVSTDTVRIENSAEASLLSDVTRRVSKDVTTFTEHVAAFAITSGFQVTLSDEFFDDDYTFSDYVEAIKSHNMGGPIDPAFIIAKKLKITDAETKEAFKSEMDGGL